MSAGILQQSIHGIQHLVREQEKPLSGRAAIIKTFLPSEDNIESPSKILRLEPHDLHGVHAVCGKGSSYFLVSISIEQYCCDLLDRMSLRKLCLSKQQF